jgi:queuosine precursor transporter
MSPINRGMALAVAAMAAVIALANFLVQFPVPFAIGPLDLSNLLTWAAFVFPLAFLVNDLTNRTLGPAAARQVVFVGFALAVAISAVVATPRLAIASGTAFLVSQLLDLVIFHRLREQAWWQAPAISSVIGATFDTLLFFWLAFGAAFAILGPSSDFALAPTPLLGLLAVEAPRWVSWALGSLMAQLVVAGLALVPYRVVIAFVPPWRPGKAQL